MLYFLGNCQMDFLGRSVADLGRPMAHKVLASPLTYTSHPGSVPADLARLVRDHHLDDHFHDRTPESQFELLSPAAPAPELLVLNLFHENVPLFVHNRDQYVFYMDPSAWHGRAEVEGWLNRNCARIAPNPATYLKRFGQFLALVRARFPEALMLLVTRLTHRPAFGPAPHSYLEGWEALSREAQAHYRVWQQELDNFHVLDMDRVFGGVWSRAAKPIEAHCPFLRITLTEADGRITDLHAGRDVEHIGTLWPALARKVLDFLDTGTVEYAEDETVPEDWNRPWQPHPLDQEAMLDRLATQNNYRWAEAVAGFYLDLAHDHTPLLAAAAPNMPVCHNTLHMIRNYGRIFKNPLLAQWCDAHEQTARTFTDNGPVYQADYLQRIAEIRAYALS